MVKLKGITGLLVMIMVAYFLVFSGTAGALTIDDSSNLVRIFEDINIEEGRIIEGDLVAIMGNINVEGRVRGDVISVLGDIHLNNTIEGDVVSVAGRITRGERAEIMGSTTQVRLGEIRIGSFLSRQRIGGLWQLWGTGTAFGLFRLIVLFGLVLLVFSLLPERERNMAYELEKSPGRILIIGLIGVLLFPVLLLLMAITIIGLPVIPLLIFLFFGINFIGYVAVVYFAGERIAAVGKNGMSIYLRLFLGVLVLWVLNSVPLFGWIFYLLLMFLSLGVVLDTKFGSGSRWFKIGQESTDPVEQNKKQKTKGDSADSDRNQKEEQPGTSSAEKSDGKKRNSDKENK